MEVRRMTSFQHHSSFLRPSSYVLRPSSFFFLLSSFFMMPNSNKTTTRRWLLLGLGIVSILGLTLMNVYSLWQLHQYNLEASEDIKRAQLRQLRIQVNDRLYKNVTDLWQMDMGKVEEYLLENRKLPDNIMQVITAAGNDSLFKRVYYTDRVIPVCETGASMMAFNPKTQQLEWVTDFPSYICDGLELVRTKTKTLLTGDYRWYTKTELDGNRTMNIALVNTAEQTVIGYLSLDIDSRWLLDNLVTDILVSEFGADSETGITVWVRDWLRDEIVATNNVSVPYDPSNIDIRERFTFENWAFHAMVNESPTVIAAMNQFIGNMIILSVAVLMLLSSIFFIFRTASRERELSMRQAGFLANVTHELKTPLAVMQAAGENLADGRVRDLDRLASYGKHIHEEALRLSRMIDKLLNVARSDAGEIVVNRQPVDLSELAGEYVAQNKNFFADRQFKVNLSVQTREMTNVDNETFQTILSNLVENAIKYSDKKNVVDIRIYSLKDRVILDVEDYGIGIPANKQKNIFEKFYRVEDPLTAKTKGHGLGLSIVKFLTQLNGGEVSLRSVYGVGSTFSLSFPIWKPMAQPAAAKQPETQSEYAVQG
jgi:signal transduction histidine kinase